MRKMALRNASFVRMAGGHVTECERLEYRKKIDYGERARTQCTHTLTHKYGETETDAYRLRTG